VKLGDIPISNLVLPEQVVHVWCLSLTRWADAYDRCCEILSEDEQNRADRFRFECHRQAFVIGRGLLRVLLSQYLQTQPNQICFTYSDRGKPFLSATCEYPAIQFNVSHSHEVALYAFTRQRKVGVDLEYIRPIEAEALVKRFFSEQEWCYFQTLPPNQQQSAFFRAWTQKEAYLKAIGEGLAYPLNQVEVAIDPTRPTQFLKLGNDTKATHNWQLTELHPVQGYAAALVVERREPIPLTIQSFQYHPNAIFE
jgi:4'-phosphopantetheinyl transferase